MSSLIDSEYYFDEASAFRELPESGQLLLGDRLMPDCAWKTAADRLGFTAVEIAILDATQPTRAAHQMLRQWSWRTGSTLRVLIQTLVDVRRRDIVAHLNDVCKRKSKSR